MTQKEIETLLSLIDKAVHESGPWTPKREAIITEASERDKANLEEFVSWFMEA